MKKPYRTQFIDYNPRLQDKNRKRYGDAPEGACIICGAPTKKQLALHCVDGGPFALHPEDEERYTPDGGDLGIQYIGPDCLRKNPELKPFIRPLKP